MRDENCPQCECGGDLCPERNIIGERTEETMTGRDGLSKTIKGNLNDRRFDGIVDHFAATVGVQRMQVGDEVRIKATWDTGIIIGEQDGKLVVRCDCGMTWHYDESKLEPLTRP